ncbi:MAG TPA: nicotinate-nucleotide adenylyltransferase [Anaerolineaceae bacterium]|nr:nicotinate-nucleotide adenylyltransferase [Anaerolineaceae bacterium]
MMRIGIFGGTFDPPHIAHLVLAAEACDQLKLDRLLWVLTPDPPHKVGWEITPLPARIEMLRAAIADNPLFELSRVDIDRPAPHYAVDTVSLLREQYPGAGLVYLVGGDSFHDLPQWYRPDALVASVDGIGVMRRPGDRVDLAAISARIPGIEARVQFVDAPLLEISGRMIRQRARQGLHYRYFLPPAVYAQIEALGLYQPEIESKG